MSSTPAQLARSAIGTLLILLSLASGACSGDPDGTASGKRFVPGPTGRLAVDDGGEGGMPVLFLHGNGADMGTWEAQLRHLRLSRRAVAMDFRGYGASDAAPVEEHTIAGMAEDVDAVARELVLDRFVLVAHSFGAAVAARYAAVHPEKLAGILFADPAGDLSRVPRENLEGWLHMLEPESYEDYTEKWFGQILQGSAEGTAAKVMASLRHTPRVLFVAAIQDLIVFDPLPGLRAFRGPMLSVVGPANVNENSLHVQVGGMPHVVMEDVSHWLMMDRPEEFNRILDRFLAEVDEQAGK